MLSLQLILAQVTDKQNASKLVNQIFLFYKCFTKPMFTALDLKYPDTLDSTKRNKRKKQNINLILEYG